MRQDMSIRVHVLASFGAEGDVAKELLLYNENRFDQAVIDVAQCPLPDESFVAIWRRYAKEIEEAGTITPLRKYLVQLQFPIQAAISKSAEYIAATRRGLDTSRMQMAVGLSLRNPRQCRLLIHPTAAGSLPMLTVRERDDFVALVRALAHRNEPHPVPDSMGACMIAGYNNWHRISVLRERFLASASRIEPWLNEFQKIKVHRDAYQDHFVILSTGPYSAVKASDIGLDDEEWLNISSAIRREHESTHYFTQRVFSSMRTNLLDELIADYIGITVAAGKFRASWLLRFFGLESFPRCRKGGRLDNYRGARPLSDAAFAVLQQLLVAASANLEDFDRYRTSDSKCPQVQAALTLMLTGLTIEEMAAPHAREIMDAAFVRALKTMETPPLSRPLQC